MAQFQILTISSLHCELPLTCMSECNHVQITCNTSSVYHVQHVVCHVVQRNNSAIKFDRVEIAFTFAIFSWLKQLTDERGENRSTRRKPLMLSFRKQCKLKQRGAKQTMGCLEIPCSAFQPLALSKMTMTWNHKINHLGLQLIQWICTEC